MLAWWLTTILPAMTLAAALKTTPIPCVAGLIDHCAAVIMVRPCRASHQTVSDVGLIGGAHLPILGEVSRAHHGRRCLNELTEIRRYVLDVLVAA
jgi:magnesium chelatase family protein